MEPPLEAAFAVSSGFPIWLSILVIAGAVYGGRWLHRYLVNLEEKRRSRINDIESFDPIETPDDLGFSIEESRRLAQKGVSQRFTIMRRTLLVLLGLIGAIIAILPFLGSVPAGALSLTAGVLSVVVGIAARPFLENFICGMVMSLSNKLRVGDTIYIDGELGTVQDINLTHTTIRIWNWQRYILPNSQMLNKAIKNCSHRENLLWTHIEFMVSHQTDLDSLHPYLAEKIKESDYFTADAQPELWPMELGDTGVRCWLAAWANGPDAAWHLRNDMRKAVLRHFRESGLNSHLYKIEFNPSGQKNENLQPPLASL